MGDTNEHKPYKLARLVNRGGDLEKRWYVEFYAWSEKKQDLVRRQIFIAAKYQTARQREKEAEKYITAINRALKEGKFFKDGEESQRVKAVERKPSFTFKTGMRYAIEIKLDQGKRRTADTFRSYWNILEEYFRKFPTMGNMKIEEVSQAHTYAFIDHIQRSRELTNRTRNNYRDILVTLFNVLVKREIVSKNPAQAIESLKAVSSRHTVFTSSQQQHFEEYLQKNDPQLYYFTRFIYYGFLRPNELVQLTLANINMQARSIVIPGEVAKNNQQQSITIIKPLYDLILKMNLEKQPKNYYLFSKNLLPGEIPIYRNRVSERHRAALELSGLYDGKLTLYSWKHTGVVNAVLSGLDMKRLKEHLRHYSLEQTDIYLRSLGVNLNKDMQDKAW